MVRRNTKADGLTANEKRRLVMLVGLLMLLAIVYLAMRPQLQAMTLSARELAAQTDAATRRAREDAEQRNASQERMQALRQDIAAGKAAPEIFAELSALLADTDPSAALKVIRQGLAAHPRSVSLWATRGLLYQEAGELAAALEALERAHELSPENRKVATALANLYTGMGWSFDARRVLERLNSGAREDPSVCMALAAAAIQTVDGKTALELLEPLTERKDVPPEVHVLAGQAWLSQSEPDRAVTAFTRALSITPQRIEIRLQLLEALLASGTPNSLAAVEKVVAEGRNHSPHERGLSRMLGFARAQQARNQEALDLLLPLAGQSGADPQLLSMTARSLRALGRASEAATLENRARTLETTGERLSRLQRRANVSKRKAEDVTALAREYCARGEKALARLELRRALRIDPGYEPARRLAASISSTQ